ncbi:DUF222 domain-containing protein [Amycolatopsis sp. QT-25]|uniref:DUF222 domain-containing protein n=1 Tax=Amycolatopsis sp. QT-25 TaxID=3034022 RepID=UPI0023ED701F|nr:DUF222 domain-containing protein [Amycolatopsis sp. QT-25]WET80767.1 DUF222 domain-containing protein [Amycolatopsis sp. QT-25]
MADKEAHARADRVLALHVRPSIGGAPEPPLAPLTAHAAAEGVIGGSQIDAIIRTLARIPSSVPEDVRAGEKILVDLARHAGPRQIARAGRRLLDTLDAHGKELVTGIRRTFGRRWSERSPCRAVRGWSRSWSRGRQCLGRRTVAAPHGLAGRCS